MDVKMAGLLSQLAYTDTPKLGEDPNLALQRDIVKFGPGLSLDDLTFTMTPGDSEADEEHPDQLFYSGGTLHVRDRLTIQNWYSGSQYHVEQFKTADGSTLLDSQVQNLVDAMAAFSPPAEGQTTLPQSYADTLEPVIAANWQ